MEANYLNGRNLFQVFFLLVVLIIGYQFYGFVRYRCKTIYRQQKNLHNPYELLWDNEFVYMNTEYGDIRTPWQDFRKFKFNESLVLLYYSDALFNLVAVRDFENSAQKDDFLSHCRVDATSSSN